jgi:AAA domain
MTTEATQQAVLACDFWTGLEYMNVVSVPDVDERRKVFYIESDAGLPWLDRSRSNSLNGSGNRYRAQIAYCGLFAKAAYTSALRSDLGAAPIAKKQLGLGDGAVLLIPLDDTGRVCGDVFVSSLAWMMGLLRDHLANGKMAETLKLVGFDEFLDELLKELRQKLVQLQLIHEEDAIKQETAQHQDAATLKMRDGKICGAPEMRPLMLSDVRDLLSIIWERCDWQPPDWQETSASGESHLIRIKLVTMTRHIERSVDLGALNSMVVADVVRVRAKLASNKSNSVGHALSQYLKLQTPSLRIDLRNGSIDNGLGVFIDSLAPNRLPTGAWPDYPLVAAQQFAVNMSRSHLTNGGLYGVNGPPGTGKSTLLRDIVADIIVARAEVIVNYDNPLAAFTRRGEIEGYKYGFWELDSLLHGHGIAVASSNNGAIENVIKDLTKLTDNISDAGLRYFSDVSDSIAADPTDKRRKSGSTWGLVAALLGSADKRRTFISRFWFETPPTAGELVDPERLRSVKGLIERNDHKAVPWSQAVLEFKEARTKVQERANAIHSRVLLVRQIDHLLNQICTVTDQMQGLKESSSSLNDAECVASTEMNTALTRSSVYRNVTITELALSKAKVQLQQAILNVTHYPSVPKATASERSAEEDASSAQRHAALVLAAKPGFMEVLFQWGAKRRWRNQLLAAGESERIASNTLRSARKIAAQATAASAHLTEVQSEFSAGEVAVIKAADEASRLGIQLPCDQLMQQQLDDVLELARKRHSQAMELIKSKNAEIRSLEKSSKKQQASLQELNLQLANVDELLGPLEPSFHNSADLLKKTDHELQLGVPYDDSTLRQLRVNAFRMAIQLNESFVVTSWKRLSNTLSAFVNYQGGKFSTAQADKAMVHLWNAFFLVVPVVSSTFASFGRLFAGLDQEQIGTLLIDEAGQSTPQNAVGAIWRSRRVIAVGDPLQLEPVVPQPREAIVPWRDWVGANRQWTPPECSVQVLADDMTPYGTVLDGGGVEDRKVWVGSPLRVHRRCLNPMFDAANQIAYANLMVHGVRDVTKVSDWIGPSKWFDIRGNGVGHWVQSQGDFTLELIKQLLETPELEGKLKNNQGQWHINVITPYKDVGTDFKNMLRDAFSDVGDIQRMAGTVHTFQGKEADVVILLLGGNPERAGAVSFFAGNEQSPNLLNVALTRAKKRIYVVGDKPFWISNSGTFRRVGELLDEHVSKNISK